VGQYTNLTRPRFSKVVPLLHDEALVCEQGVQRFGQAVEGILRKYGKNVIGQQLISKRLADAATEIFVGMCVLSRVSGVIERQGEEGAQEELRIARIYTHFARSAVLGHLKGLYRNSDYDLSALADTVITKGCFRWDTV
jgi:hypothetical protein